MTTAPGMSGLTGGPGSLGSMIMNHSPINNFSPSLPGVRDLQHGISTTGQLSIPRTSIGQLLGYNALTSSTQGYAQGSNWSWAMPGCVVKVADGEESAIDVAARFRGETIIFTRTPKVREGGPQGQTRVFPYSVPYLNYLLKYKKSYRDMYSSPVNNVNFPGGPITDERLWEDFKMLGPLTTHSADQALQTGGQALLNIISGGYSMIVDEFCVCGQASIPGMDVGYITQLYEFKDDTAIGTDSGSGGAAAASSGKEYYWQIVPVNYQHSTEPDPRLYHCYPDFVGSFKHVGAVIFDYKRQTSKQDRREMINNATEAIFPKRSGDDYKKLLNLLPSIQISYRIG